MKKVLAVSLSLFFACLHADAQITGISIETVVVHDGSVDASLDGYTTYRIYADVTSELDFVSSVRGNVANPLILGCTGTIYQSSGVNFNVGIAVDPVYFTDFPAAEYDSWLTIGVEDVNGVIDDNGGFDLDPGVFVSGMNPALMAFNSGSGFVLNNSQTSYWGIPWPCIGVSDFAACADSVDTFGGPENRVLLAQITATGDVYGLFNAVFSLGGIPSPGTTSVVNGLTFSSNAFDVFGCTNVEALNYDPAATKDDLSCIFPCSIEIVLDDVSATGCYSNVSGEIDVSATGVQGGAYYFLDSIPQGAIEEPAVGSSWSGHFDVFGGDTYTVFVVDGAGCTDSLQIDMCIPGCMSYSACNFDPSATVPDNNTCIYAEEFYDCDGNSLCESSQSLSSLTIEVTHNVLDSLDLYRLYVDLPPIDNWYVSAVWADQGLSSASENPLRLSTQFYASEGVFNSSFNTSWSAQGISTAFVAVFPELAYDSFATIGLSGPASESSIPGAVDPSFVGDVQSTDDFVNFFTSNGFQELELFDGAWYILPTNYQLGLADENGRCLVGQICTSGALQGQVLVQLLQSDGSGGSIDNQGEFARYAFNGAGQFSGVGFGFSGFGPYLTSIPICGCDDPQASNFIPWVEFGTDTCEYFCANDEDEDGICDEVDDCIGQLDVCGVCNGLGEVYECGCFSIPDGDCDCEGNVEDAIGECGGSCTLDNDNNGVCDDQEIYGCSYELAENFDPSVTRDNGSCIFPCEGAVNINVFDWDGDYAVTVTDFLMMLSVYGDVDVDLDGIWDSGDLCVDTDACNYATDPSEPCASLDVLGICGGGCEADEDADGICDDVDTCVGIEDECGVCNGPGPTEIVIEDITVLYDSVYLPQLDEWYVYEFGADTTFSYTCAPPSFSTCGDPVSYQGYDYATVLIGDQCWFAENLRNENYENGEAIISELNIGAWLGIGSFGTVSVYGDTDDCFGGSPDFDPCNPILSLTEYGRLYSWHAVNDVRGLCPIGWHVPTDGEWTILTDYLGGDSIAGGQMRTESGWYGNIYGTNTSGFSGLPAGFRSYPDSGPFSGAGSFASWWSSSSDGEMGWRRYLTNCCFNPAVFRGVADYRSQASIRCVRDAE